MRQLIASLAKAYITPVLSAHGFRRSGLTWNRRLPGIVHVLNIQVSRWSDEEQVHFTVNIGVSVEQVWRICRDKPVPKTVRESDCFPRSRVSYVMDSVRDIWWVLGTPADVERTGIEIQDILLNKCIPFLSKQDSLGGIVAVADDPALRRMPVEQLSYAILKHLTGARAEARQILDAWLADEKRQAWHDCVRGVRERLACMP